MSAPLIEIRNARVFRGQTQVFDGLDLTVAQGESVVILGPNGCGKTTLLKLLGREIYPVADPLSWVKILGRERFHINELRSQIGIVSHDLQLAFISHDYPGDKRGREVVLSGLCNSIGLHAIHTQFEQTQRKRAQALMSKLDINALADTPFKQMSTGQQRRVLLARALVHQPATLVLDEPTSGLDLPASFAVQRMLSQLIGAGTALVLVTHHVNEIPPQIERVVLLREGTVFADGPRDQVLTEARLSALYGCPITLLRSGEHILAVPGG